MTDLQHDHDATGNLLLSGCLLSLVIYGLILLLLVVLSGANF